MLQTNSEPWQPPGAAVGDAELDERLVTWVSAVAADADTEAFSELFRHFAPRLKTFYMRQGTPAASAEELVQECMLSVWRRASSYRPDVGRVSTWIYTIARNVGIDRLRKERRPEGTIALEDIESPEPAGEDLLEAHERAERLRRAMRTLPPEQNQVLSLAYFRLRTAQEIAAELGIPAGTVKSRMRLAIERLRNHMKE